MCVNDKLVRASSGKMFDVQHRKVPHLCEVAAEQCLSDMEGSDLGHGAESISHSSLNQVHCIGPCRSDYFPFPFIESHPWMGRP